MLKLMMGLWLGWCMLATSVSYADTGATEDTGAAEDAGTEDTGATEDTGTEDTGATDDPGEALDTGTTSSSTTSTPTYGAAELAGDSGSCATAAATPAAWMLGCFLLALARRREN